MEEATRLEARERFRSRYAAVGALGALLVLVVGLHLAGAFDRIDRHAVAHWMPGIEPDGDERTWPPVTGLFLPFSPDEAWWDALLGLLMYPASVLVSFLVFAACATRLWRGGARFPAVVWGGSWIAANAVEVALKASITREPLYGQGADGAVHHLRGYDHAFPSGHMLRAVMLAGLAVYLWRRLLWPAVVWVLGVAVSLVVSGSHVPADVIGGAVFGLFVVVAVWTVAGDRRLERRAAARVPALSRAA